MIIDRRAVVAAISLSLLFTGCPQAKSKHKDAQQIDSQLPWDGTWSGNWGGQESEATSVTIVNNNVVSFEYRGASTPVSASVVTPTTVSYEHDQVSVTMTRTGPATAMASLHSAMGEATTQLTRR